MAWDSQIVQIWSDREDNPPDVFVQEIGQILLEIAKSGKLANITDLWEKYGFYDVFPSWVIEKCALEKEMYAVPSKIYTFAVWYLVDIFKKYKVEPPNTWDEFLNVCQSLKRRGMMPIVASAWENSIWFNHILAGIAGSKFYSDLMDGKESWFDSKVVEAYEVLREITLNFFLPHPFAYDFPTSWESLNRHKAAMILQGDWLDGMWQRQYGFSPGTEYDFFLLPPANPRVGHTMVVGGNAWASFRKCQNPSGAKNFLAYAGSLNAHELLAKEGMGILAHMDVSENAYNPILRRLRRELFSRQIVFQTSVLLPPRAVNIEERERRHIIINPGITREEILEAATIVEKVCRRT